MKNNNIKANAVEVWAMGDFRTDRQTRQCANRRRKFKRQQNRLARRLPIEID